MKLIQVTESVGMVLCHDITEIVPGRFKGPAFKRGHIIRKQDVGKLRDLGKEHIAVLELGPDRVHEDDAAECLARAAAGNGIVLSKPSEGKVNLVAAMNGLLKINVNQLDGVNSIEDIMLATLHTNRLVKKGQVVAGTRIIPLTIDKAVLTAAESRCHKGFPIIEVKEIHLKRIGIVTTGSEVFHQRIKDKFGPVVREKVVSLGSSVLRQIFVPDDVAMTVAAIKDLIAEGAEVIMITGGMSVDPDDCTPGSIRATGAEVITYGAPVLPGAMFMLGYINDIPVVGLPGCVMYHRASIFELIVPMIVAGEEVTKEYISSLGHGGFCSNCKECRYPVCGFGKQ